MLIQIALPAILTFIMFTLGLGLKSEDFLRVAREPRAFGIGAGNQLLVVPLAGFAVATAFVLPPELAVGVMILAFCPGGVLTNVLTRFANGSTALSVSLTAVISLVSIVTLPVLVALSVRYFMGAEAPPVDVTRLGLQMFLLTAVPVALGMGLTRLAPDLVSRISGWMMRLAFFFFVLMIIAALAANWSTFTANFPTLGPALLTMNVLLLAIGVASGKAAGLGIRDTTTVAIESGIQNGTLGIAVGMLVAGAESGLPAMTLPTAIYSVTTWIVSIPFVMWRRSVTAPVAA